MRTLARIRIAALAAGLAAAFAVAVRAAWGPVALGPWRMRSPLPAESAFAICFLFLAIVSRRRDSEAARATPRSDWVPLGLMLALVAAVFARNVADPFLSDDYILLTHATAQPRAILRLFRTAGGDGAFRPLGYLYFGLMKSWAGTDPLKWHIAGLIVHLLNCSLLYAIAIETGLGAAAAFTGAVLFGVHGTRPEAVAWTAGSFDLLAAFFVLAAVALFFARAKGGEAGALLLLALGILAKESAYCAPFLILGIAAAARRLDRRAWRFIASAAIVSALLFAYRWMLFRGPGGYVDPATGRPQILSMRLLPTLKALFVRIWAILLFPVDWEAGAGIGLALALLACCVILLHLAARRPARLPLLATVVLCALPAVHLALIAESAIGSRILYLPSVAFCLLIGLLAESRKLLSAGLIVATALVTMHNLAAWHRTAELAARTCEKAAQGDPVEAPPRTVDGVYFFANGFPECVAMKRRASSP